MKHVEVFKKDEVPPVAVVDAKQLEDLNNIITRLRRTQLEDHRLFQDSR